MLELTTPKLLVQLGAVSAGLAWVIIGWLARFDRLPYGSYGTAVLFAGLAVAVLVLVWPLRQWNRGVRQRPVNPLRAARLVAFTRSCSRAGALFAGWFVGHAVYLVPDVSFVPQREQLVKVIIIAMTALGLTIAGYIAERWCRLPPDDLDGGAARPQGDGAPA